MTQGTISVLFGCHSIVHSVLVVISWIKLSGRMPSIKQIVCIFLHDVGHMGKNYLDDEEQKKSHWKLGASIARLLFKEDWYEFTAGHCVYSGYRRSSLYYADKFSWSIAPTWWLWWNSIVEPKLNCGMGVRKAVELFKKQVKESIDSGKYLSTHDFYTKRKLLSKKEE